MSIAEQRLQLGLLIDLFAGLYETPTSRRKKKFTPQKFVRYWTNKQNVRCDVTKPDAVRKHASRHELTQHYTEWSALCARVSASGTPWIFRTARHKQSGGCDNTKEQIRQETNLESKVRFKPSYHT